jgi:hypothetical protein
MIFRDKDITKSLLVKIISRQLSLAGYVYQKRAYIYIEKSRQGEYTNNAFISARGGSQFSTPTTVAGFLFSYLIDTTSPILFRPLKGLASLRSHAIIRRRLAGMGRA